MYEKMRITIEENKLRDRFGTMFVASIIDVLNQEDDIETLKHIGDFLQHFNSIVSVFDEVFCKEDAGGTEEVDSDEGSKELSDEIDSMLRQELLRGLNKLYVRLGKLDFLKKYSDAYWAHTQEKILTLWRELPDDKSIATDDILFIKIFEDFFSETNNALPGFLLKQLKEFHNLYRASGYEVFDNYKYIIPDPAYCKDNRWNDDGVAFLYLSYDNEDKMWQGIKKGKKTCFEELRAKDGKQLAVCRFKPTHRKAKILDLSYDEIDYESEINKLDSYSKKIEERLRKVISQKPKLQSKLSKYVESGDIESFNLGLGKLQDKHGVTKEAHQNVQEVLSRVLIGNICASIFYAVDKEDDPELEAYIPFRVFSRYLISKGIDGVAYRSTRMELAGLHGKCLTLFNVSDATFVEGTMEVYEYHKDGCKLLKQY